MRLIEFFEATRLDELVNPDNPKFRKWFRNSKVTDITGKRPQMVFHGTKSPHEFIELQPGTHFGTPGQAEEFAAMSGGDRPRTGPGRIFPVYLRIENPIEMWDSQASHGDDPDAYLRDLITHAESVDDRNLVDRLKLWANAINWDNIPDEKKPVRLIAFLKKLGYDGIVYSNRQEDKGYRSWIPFNKSQIKYVYAESITEATVYHGSPHKFDRFDVSFMGSGEGNQTYGWGIYFAEHPEVARSYQQMGDRWAEWQGQKILYPWHRNRDTIPSEIAIAGTALAQANGDPEEARHVMSRYMYSDYRQMPKLFGRVFKNLPELAKQIEVKSTQNLYTVEISDNVINNMLDWDEALHNQKPAVKGALLQIQADHPDVWKESEGWANELYTNLSFKLGSDQATSEYLNSIGIPGNIYLDQGSRESGGGTHNIVLFDPRHAKILDRRTPVGEEMTEAVAYHGSPHKFGKFDIQQIGSGQGAQTYGWGLYFAEEPDVALDYYKQLTRSKQGEVFVGDKKSEYKDPAVALAVGAMNWGGDPIENLKRVKPGKLYTPDAIRKAIRIIKTGKTRYEAPGAVYTVEIPDQVMAGLLDWDKPINEQPENVREAFGFNEPMDHFRDWYQKRLEIIGDEYSWHRLSKRQQNAQLREYTKETGQKPPAILQWDQTMATGKDLYQHMTSEAGSPEQASKYLDKAGVPGLKFLDQFSREKGKGTYNIVMFDDRFVNIVDQRVPGKRAA